MVRLLEFILTFAAIFANQATSFTVPRLRTPTLLKIAEGGLKRTNAALLMSKNDSDDEDVGINAGSTDEQKRIGVPKWLENTLQFALFLISNAFTALSLCFSAGLILNLVGYGYRFEDGGIRIDTLPKLKEEVQFRRAVYSSMEEAYSTSQSQIGGSKMAPPGNFVGSGE
eukprot:CAMPEP_0198137172 /NCGR_PEP_ID=MMETSP1443-20131203/708_1 /TAXON_ID=186043 /ORGANISM="Entomoneis sp., Strain CCMP2396" /LENGTH=169 /DNA_ID=CAMNT_0043798519 /DNA_START=36 /DNA_END=545 /DNA_ORIENTATION=+